MKKLILAMTILGTAFGRVQPAQAGGCGAGVAIAAAVGLVVGAAITASAYEAPRYYAPVCAPAPVVYAAATVVYVPPPPVVVYRPAVVAVPAPVVYGPVLYGAPRYRSMPYHRVIYRGR